MSNSKFIKIFTTEFPDEVNQYENAIESLAETTKNEPFVTIEIDLAEANNAKSEYPITMFRHYE